MRARNTLVMAVVAVVLGAAVYFLEIRGASEREEAERVADRLLRFETEDVTGLTIDRADGTIALTKTDDTWRITAPYDLAADETAVSSVVNRMQSADHERVIDEEPDDLARFGLAEPELTVTLQLASGESRALQFGDGTPVGFNVFVKRPDDPEVFIAAAGIKDAADKTLFDLRNRSILDFADADVARLEIESEALTATLERQTDAGDGIDRWRLSDPIEASADADTISGLLQRLRTGNALAFASDEPTDEELAEYGLDEPSATVRVWTSEDAAHTLLLGGTAEEPAGRYARRLGADAVMVVPANLATDLPEDLDELRNRTVVEFARDRVNAIGLTVEERPEVRLEKDGIDWHIVAPQSLDGDASTIAALLTGALGLRAREFPEGSVDDARFGMGAPHARVTFELEEVPGDESEEMSVETVTLIVGAATDVEPEEEAPPATDTEEGAEAEPVAARYVSVDGESTVFTVEEADLEDLLVDLFALRSKTLVSFAQSDLTRLEVSTDSATRELVKDDDGQWTLGGQVIDDTAPVDDALWRLNYLDMQTIVVDGAAAADADLGFYGLAEPALRIRAWIDDEIVADVNIGDAVPEDELQELPPFAARSQTYATVGGTPGVFRIDAALRDAIQALAEAIS